MDVINAEFVSCLILRPIMGLLTGLTTSDTGAGPGEGQLRSQLTSCW